VLVLTLLTVNTFKSKACFCWTGSGNCKSVIVVIIWDSRLYMAVPMPTQVIDVMSWHWWHWWIWCQLVTQSTCHRQILEKCQWQQILYMRIHNQYHQTLTVTLLLHRPLFTCNELTFWRVDWSYALGVVSLHKLGFDNHCKCDFHKFAVWVLFSPQVGKNYRIGTAWCTTSAE